MRFAYVLLGVVTLASVHTSRGVCSDGVEGVQTGDVCCDAQCGTCGGPGCGSRPGGPESCCQTDIWDSEIKCSESLEAPCIIDDVCSNGLKGVQTGNVCCDAQCGTCGGPGCGSRPGGPASCCQGTIWNSGTECSESLEAPCVIDDLCRNGVEGVQTGNVCCDVQCGTCGGPGCGSRPGGPTDCCQTAIWNSGVMCSETSEAPCIIDGAGIEES